MLIVHMNCEAIVKTYVVARLFFSSLSHSSEANQLIESQ